MATLKGDIRRFFESLPGGVLSHHDQIILPITLIVARHISDQNEAEELVNLLLRHASHRPNQSQEVRNALTGAYLKQNNPNYKPSPKPKAEDPAYKAKHLGEPETYEHYLRRTDPIPRTTAEALTGLFQPSDIIFIQSKVEERSAAQAVSRWIDSPNLSDLQFLTFNTFHPDQPRHQDQVHLRRYLIHETDDPSLSFEQQFGLIKRLEKVATLKMIVNSGGKSLHAWFHWSPGEKKPFLELSQTLGGDPRFRLMNQLCRLPWGTRRKEGNLPAGQPIIYWKD